jgi:oxygen-independent coproporphyrinogen-3 oxidase
LTSELSLYVHFPFCKRKCLYCDFNSYSDRSQLIPAYCQALLQEMERYPLQERLRTVYFGGGTPSFLPSGLVADLLGCLKERFHYSGGTGMEITIEINPGTATRQDLLRFREAGFNRLSLGLQAAQNRLLALIGRIHTWEEFRELFGSAREIGFANIGVDLIFGLPDQSLADWRETLARVLELEPEHISAYGLQVEEGTPLAGRVAAGRLHLPDEETGAAMFQAAMDTLRDAGYDHYEISNYARPGYYSEHNLGYWTGRDYLGLGAGASSTCQGERWVNVREPGEYIARIREGLPIREEQERLGRTERLTEAVMLGLRLRSGLRLDALARDFGIDLMERSGPAIARMEEQGLLTIHDGRLILSDDGVLVSNQVIAALLKNLD